MAKTDSNLPKTRAGAYLWEVPGKPVAVYIALDVVDRILQDTMRGFGAVPKRGAEIGGILLGKSTTGPRLTVEIEDYEMIPIEYRRGPSYLLSDADKKAFEETYSRLRHGFKNGAHPVGMFRSQTRDAVGLGPEDLELLDRFLPEADKVVLLIQPFATRVSTAGFYFRESGKFQSGPPLVEFPFRRKELAGEGDSTKPSAPQPERPMVRGQAAPPAPRPDAPAANGASLSLARSPLISTQAPAPAPSLTFDDEPEEQQGRSGWMWLPLSFIFLLLGVLLGFQAALTLRPQTQPGAGDPFNTALSVSKDGDDLNVRWDRQAAAIHSARRGQLVIEDGPYTKTVELDANQLQTGSVVYRHSSPDVKFRLELMLHDRNTLVEKLEWKE